MSIQNFRDKSIYVSISSSQGSPTSSAEKIQLFEPHSITLTSTTVHPPKIPSEQSPLLSCKDPVDKYNAAWIIFLILGTGSLLPWTAAINAADYYMTIYHFFPEFMFFLALANNYSSLVLAPIVLKIMPRFPYAPRVVISYLSYFAMVAITPFLILLFDPVRAVYFTYATVFVCGMTTSVLMGTLFGLVALYPPKYASAMMSGLGFAGVLTSALRILTKSVFPHTAEGLQHSAEVYFIATAVVFLICIICYFILLRLPVTKYHVHNFREAQASSRRFNSARHLPEDVSLRAVLKKVSREQFTVFGSFFITLALFPGITGLIVPTANISADWFRLIITSIFNFGEFFGRFIPRWYVACSQFSLPYAAVTRVVFLIIFPLCIKPVLIANDYVIYVILAIFAISNGYFSTLGMMFGPTRVHCEERESAGMILAFGMNLGVLCGSHFAFLILYLLTGAVV